METITGLKLTIKEMAARIRTLREIEGYTPAQMAEKTGVSVDEYLDCESGNSDLNFAFLYRCASVFGVDVTDLIQGLQPHAVAVRSYAQRRGPAHRAGARHDLFQHGVGLQEQDMRTSVRSGRIFGWPGSTPISS